MRYLQVAVRAISSIPLRSPLTLRSILLILFCGYLVLGPIPFSSDIIAAALAYGFLSLLGVILLGTSLLAILVKRNLSVTLYLPEGPIISGKATRCVLTTSRFLLLPGAVLECRPRCLQDGLELPTLKFYRSTERDTRLPIDLVAPHRGNWDIHGIECALCDLTGFIRFSWTIPLDTSLVVHPPEQPDALLPLVSSTQRLGDLVTDTVHRHGDPFDTKPYHPADGVKKIIWKVFAKSGELLARHPEASMTPEGFIAMYVLARPEDDDVGGKSLAYVRAISEMKLELLLNCEGYNGRPLGKDISSCRELLVDATWDSLGSNTATIADDLQALYDACSSTSNAITVRRIIIFCSGSRLASQDGGDLMQGISEWMEQRGIEPVFFLTQPEVTSPTEYTRWQRLGAKLFTEHSDKMKSVVSADGYQKFLASCLAKKWEVFV